MRLNPEQSQLILVDYQQRLMPAMQDSEQVLANALRLAQLAALFQVPCWGTEQTPEKLGENVAAIRSLCRQTVPKHHFGALDDSQALLWQLLDHGRHTACVESDSTAPPPTDPRQFILAGCEAHVCLLQTAMALLEKGRETWIVTDACSSRTASNRDAAFTRLNSAGARLVTTEMVAFEWCRTAQHPQFKPMLALIK